jgi:hypothetical protein
MRRGWPRGDNGCSARPAFVNPKIGGDRGQEILGDRGPYCGNRSAPGLLEFERWCGAVGCRDGQHFVFFGQRLRFVLVGQRLGVVFFERRLGVWTKFVERRGPRGGWQFRG